ncbi:hypothetical protein [Zhouia amylolytica]|uniref:Lipocalin-like domain-containing protein n=1 Tax=Zhouia amylolytica AD3 TaxID=1286632 RepID=W2UUL3_9FLAO|nr:hypothetical protein [Zhouia amylolytica]ETN97057.1 hypothetical protein P278_04830 [Zhouia amylolytica AD3]
MRSFLYLIAFIFLFTNCTTPVKEQINSLNGYWEIHKVEFPSGETKTYDINKFVDFIELKTDTSGIRKKLAPKIDGSFSSNNDHEDFRVSIQNKHLYLIYSTPFAEWKEEVLKVNKDQLIVINKEKLKYFYKRYKKLTLN